MGDPLEDFERRDAREVEMEKRLPRCGRCDGVIYPGDRVLYKDGEWFCADCVENMMEEYVPPFYD